MRRNGLGYHLVGRINSPTFLLRDDTPPTSCRCARTTRDRALRIHAPGLHTSEGRERERERERERGRRIERERERVNAPSSWINEADYSARFSRRHGPDRALEPFAAYIFPLEHRQGRIKSWRIENGSIGGQGRVNFQVHEFSRLPFSEVEGYGGLEGERNSRALPSSVHFLPGNRIVARFKSRIG